MFIKLSYPLSETTPFYKGLQSPKLEQLYDLAKGDTCNSFYLTTSNHAGTHVDAPNHFNPNGRKITDYEVSDLVFSKPALLDVRVGRDELIIPEHLGGYPQCRSDCDFLFVRSGFGKYRNDATEYVEHSPGFSAAAADFLMKQLPDLKALAVDFVSIAAMAHMEEGCEAHRVFLGCSSNNGRSILLVEDICLPDLLPALDKVYLIPWLFEGLDSAPCTLFGEFSGDVQSV